jgi:alpha-mannosidase
MISLTLLKSPQGPDPEADQGAHTFTYALLPHIGDFAVETVVHEAYALNIPPTVVKIKDTQDNEISESRLENVLCEVLPSNVIVEAIKKAENEDAAIIRLYEAGKMRSNVRVRFTNSLRRAALCNLMEEKDQALTVDDDSVYFEMRPFEIKTLKVTFRG